MFYLFIFESIGTSELMLIGLVALIVFGPRKLPEFARTIGKTMSDFRRTTDDFKKTWEQEIVFEEEKKNPDIVSNVAVKETENKEETISRNILNDKPKLIEPKIKEIKKEDFDKNLINEINPENQMVVDKIGDKRDWL